MQIFQYGPAEIGYLTKRDRKLGRVIREIGMIERPVTPDLFEALVAGIASQQISAKAATTVWHRFKERFGRLSPETIAAASPGEIQQCGISMRKAMYIKGIGEAVTGGCLDLDQLKTTPDEEVIARLTALNGVGAWTAEMLLIFSMERADVVSWGDLAIRRGMMRLYDLDTLDRHEFERYRKRYSPFGSVASLYLWEISHR